MKDFIVPAKERLPEINFNASTGILNINGVFEQGHDQQFIELYNSLYDWLKAYSISPAKVTVLNLRLENLNTSAGKPLLYILKVLEGMYQSGLHISVNWYLNDDDENMHEDAEDYKDVLKIPINLIEIKADYR